MAAQLDIDDVRLDWRQALATLRPDIVAIATTAAPHREMAEFAAQLGCHILCEKPLGVNAADARAMLLAASSARYSKVRAWRSAAIPMRLPFTGNVGHCT
jgi:predicted dehydrogenase